MKKTQGGGTPPWSLPPVCSAAPNATGYFDLASPLVQFGGPFSGGTDLIVWRDTKAAPEGGTGPLGCGGPPSWYPLREQDVHAYDEDGNQALNVSNSAFFPLATQRMPANDLGALGFGRWDPSTAPVPTGRRRRG
ncbi:MAG: hypothetical protein AAF481_01920 [Acidobacteriota bacterium]